MNDFIRLFVNPFVSAALGSLIGGYVFMRWIWPMMDSYNTYHTKRYSIEIREVKYMDGEEPGE